MERYRTKTIEISAIQWNAPGDHPDVHLCKREGDPCVRCGVSVDHAYMRTRSGISFVCKGDYQTERKTPSLRKGI